MIRPCPLLARNNRTPAKHLSDTGRCNGQNTDSCPVVYKSATQIDSLGFTETNPQGGGTTSLPNKIAARSGYDRED